MRKMGKKCYSGGMSHSEQEPFGQTVREARMKLGMKQEELAEAANVSRRTIGNIENGRHDAQSHVKVRIRRALAMPEPDEQPDDIEPLLASIRILLEKLDAVGRARVIADVVAMIGEEIAPPSSPSPAPEAAVTPFRPEDFDLAAMSGVSEGEHLRKAWDVEQETPEVGYDGDEPA